MADRTFGRQGENEKLSQHFHYYVGLFLQNEIITFVAKIFLQYVKYAKILGLKWKVKLQMDPILFKKIKVF